MQYASVAKRKRLESSSILSVWVGTKFSWHSLNHCSQYKQILQSHAVIFPSFLQFVAKTKETFKDNLDFVTNNPSKMSLRL